MVMGALECRVGDCKPSREQIKNKFSWLMERNGHVMVDPGLR